jgi:hypothetical protein
MAAALAGRRLASALAGGVSTLTYDPLAMRVLNLRCEHGHLFEGWFGSEEDFLDQNGRQLIECPMCADRVITRMPSAPRLNLSGAKAPVADNKAGAASPARPAGQGSAPTVVAERSEHARATDVQAMWMQVVNRVMAGTEDVGERFAEEARRIHYGEAPERPIRGAASAEERAALLEEGIDVIPLLLPSALRGPVQ